MRWLPVIAAAVIMGTSGYLHGLQTDRWGLPERVTRAAEKLNSVPTVLGDWASEEIEIPDRQLEQAEAVGHLSRSYVNRQNGRRVDVLIVCGRPGPIATHPPTVCFQGAGLRLKEHERRFAVNAADGSLLGNFWLADFTRMSDGVRVWKRTFWGWQAVDSWHAPDNPRIDFAVHPYLYKMYIMRTMSDDSTPPENDACIEFMRLFIPALNQAISQNA